MIQSEDRRQPAGSRGLLLIPLAAAALLVCGVETMSAQAPGSDSIPRYQLDSLVVSVLGTPVRVGESPYAISVAGRADLREGKSGMFLQEALRSLPGVQVQNRFNYAVGERVSIRGFGSRAQFGVRGIHVVVDGIPATLPDGQSTLDHVDIASLGRVEALRGPASALYGNASGGVLRFQTEIPAVVPVRQEGTVVGGSDGLLRLQSTTTGTIGSTGYLLSLNRLTYDGFRQINADTPLGPAGTRYGQAERLHVNARVENQLGGGTLGISFNHLDLDAENPGSLRIDQIEADPSQVFIPAYVNNRTGKEVQQSQLGLTWLGPVGPLTAEAAVYGLARDFLNPLPGDVVDVDRRAGGARLALRSQVDAGPDATVELHGGVELDLQDDDRREFTNSAGQPDVLQQDQTENVRSVGLFLQGVVGIGDRVDLVAGIRYDRSRFDVDDHFPVTPGVDEDDSGTRTMDSFSPTIGVHADITPEVGIFANVATSFETPTTVELGNRQNGSGGFNPDLDPQTGRTLELGLRGAFAERVSYEATFFNTRLENELIPFENDDLLTYYRNAGSSVRNGLELVLWARAHDLLSVRGSYSYTNAEFDEYTLASGENLSGKKVPGLAPHQLQASVRAGPSAWYIDLGMEYTGEVPVNDINCLDSIATTPCAADRSGFAEAYTLFGARMGGNAFQLGPVQVSPFAGVQNLTDKTYISSVTVNAFGNRFYEPGPGRTFYVGGTVAISR
jgi:iron complex outermembrane recepter protein